MSYQNRFYIIEIIEYFRFLFVLFLVRIVVIVAEESIYQLCATSRQTLDVCDNLCMLDLQTFKIWIVKINPLLNIYPMVLLTYGGCLQCATAVNSGLSEGGFGKTGFSRIAHS